MKRSFEEELVKSQMEVQEQTLQTIGSDIHDNIGQLLSLTKVTLSTIAIGGGSPKEQHKIDTALHLLGMSIKDLRQLASVVHAENLLKEGLEKAIENELGWLAKSERFEITWRCTGDRKSMQSPQKELIAFRLIQELLNNIIKHAEATAINVDFQYLEKAYEIQIRDNGKGFDVRQAVADSRGMGLNNLFKRAQMIEGELTLTSEEGKGTTATLNIPL
ncbi:ATP-binding protein [Flavitalea sp. BT771]|uniref:sensor histidine kinase n=1 Tax=Flavitalea sp. BT771 TaxID=3063329 RepID=UPI0026E17CA0|nr:ATP-binding protein [Flavitalea sp. BT771]MDO6433002.1 ATP-binding protein [Flavitalea sp. BT771]MDV6221722.1 ATP-binding protein [Flavitalea sp. BT771]